ncbi:MULTISPECIES: hypothetical protein [Asticcacaulis]|uniref:hypothetical protein n=1 Tax=Asticcacaulis TaxID=76890 RepID=UPI001AE1346C|nr:MULTISPECIES: hypothetical protein [Asticcacaulis]MBP2160266.1 hypothetical protein [Asticcacaulis solisilvae]MDR6801431.1 hypothetical protein [Asticcacaulis sp. BE141]
MSKRNMYIAGGLAAFLALAVGYWFTAHLWTAMRVKSEAKRLIVASLPEKTAVEFQDLKAYTSFTVCGQISIANGRGGYTGFEPFIWQKVGGVELMPKVEAGSDEESSQRSDLAFWQDRYSSCMAEGY